MSVTILITVECWQPIDKSWMFVGVWRKKNTKSITLLINFLMTKRRELNVPRCLKKESIKSITKLINCWQQKDEFACLYFYLKHQINNSIVNCWQHRVGCLYLYFKNKSIKSITILINCWQQIDERWMFVGAVLKDVGLGFAKLMELSMKKLYILCHKFWGS